ncbi:MAG: isoprenylcysteine carboxyl methyltransferase, partial [Mesorhizobium sp.]
MRVASAIAGSIIFLAVAPGVVAGLVPWLLTDRYRLPWSRLPGFVPVGWLLVVAGTVVL